jgi:hypothetical protein
MGNMAADIREAKKNVHKIENDLLHSLFWKKMIAPSNHPRCYRRKVAFFPNGCLARLSPIGYLLDIHIPPKEEKKEIRYRS